MPDSLAVWSLTSDAALTTINQGDAPAGSSADSSFRVKNQSMVYRALNVTVTLTGANATDCYLSADGHTFTAALSLGDLLPSGVTDVLYLRRVTPAASGTGTKTCNLQLQAASWAT